MRRDVKTWFRVPEGLDLDTHRQAICVARAGAFLIAATLARNGPMAIIDVMDETSLSRNSVQYHARFLERAGLVRRVQHGLTGLAVVNRTHMLAILRLADPAFNPADDVRWKALKEELQAALRPFRVGRPRVP